MKLKKNRVLLLMACCMLFGCGKTDEVVFVDADSIQKEAEADVDADAVVYTDSEQVQNEAATVAVQKIIVHVCGAVASPGVYELTEGSRIIDAVNEADGLLLTAASDYVNLAAVVSDGEKIWIPTVEEVKELAQNPNAFSDITAVSGNVSDKTASQTTDSGKININTADKTLLCTLPGIGETRAESIIDYREKHGGFSCIEDIMNVSGIKDSSFQKIKDYIVVK